MTEAVPVAFSTTQEEAAFSAEFAKQADISADSCISRRAVPIGADGLPDAEHLSRALRQFYRIPEVITYLAETPFHRAALQFPDELLADSGFVTREVELGVVQTREARSNHKHDKHKKHKKHDKHDGEECKKTCADCQCSSEIENSAPATSSEATNTSFSAAVLADTSYAPCCVDTVAAEHMGADIVVHFGDSCLNAVSGAAVHVLGAAEFDADAAAATILAELPNAEDAVAVMAGTLFHEWVQPLAERIAESRNGTLFSELAVANSDSVVLGAGGPLPQEQLSLRGTAESKVAHRQFYPVPRGDAEPVEDLSSHHLVYIGAPAAPLLLYLTTRFASVRLLDPRSSPYRVISGPFPALQRRYRFMHVARSAGVVGVLINTLSLRNTNALVRKVVEWIREAGKKHYLFVFGKPNVAKLANFDAVDVWVVVGCGEGGVVVDEKSEYYKPIITPYELRLALAPEVSWTGQWVIDNGVYVEEDGVKNAESTNGLSKSETRNTENTREKEEEEDEDAPIFDSITGKYVSTHRPLRALTRHIDIGVSEGAESGSETSLARRVADSLVIGNTVAASAKTLQNRMWKGLGSDFSPEEAEVYGYDEAGAVVEEGLSGVARGYSVKSGDRH